jgi:hypothetical protein
MPRQPFSQNKRTQNFLNTLDASHRGLLTAIFGIILTSVNRQCKKGMLYECILLCIVCFLFIFHLTCFCCGVCTALFPFFSEDLWDSLQTHFSLDQVQYERHPHPLFGNVRDLVEKTFVEQKYLRLDKETNKALNAAAAAAASAPEPDQLVRLDDFPKNISWTLVTQRV